MRLSLPVRRKLEPVAFTVHPSTAMRTIRVCERDAHQPCYTPYARRYKRTISTQKRIRHFTDVINICRILKTQTNASCLLLRRCLQYILKVSTYVHGIWPLSLYQHDAHCIPESRPTIWCNSSQFVFTHFPSEIVYVIVYRVNDS